MELSTESFVITCVCAQYMDEGLREQILIKQEHPSLSITKTIILRGMFSGYMLENIKVKQLLSNVMNLPYTQLLMQRSR